MAPSEVNANNDISDILEEVAKVQNIKNYKVVADSKMAVGDGFLSNFYKGHVIDRDSGNSFTVAIKKAPKWEFNYAKVFGNEINFYSKVLPALKQLQREGGLSDPFDNAPEYFCSRSDDTNRFIALEHLHPKGYVLHDKKAYFNKSQLEFVFNLYGKLHGLSFVLRKQDIGKYEEIKAEYQDAFALITDSDVSNDFLEKAIKNCLGDLDPTSDIFKVSSKIFENVIPTIQKALYYAGDYKCLTHGDCWSNNMLFKFSESGDLEDVKLIDFQLARESTPVHDLSYFFYSSASKSDFDVLEEYLKIYHNQLSRVLKTFGESPEEIFPFDKLIQEWKENGLLGVTFAFYLWQLKLLDKEEYVDLLTDIDGAKQSMEEGTKYFKNLVEKVIASDPYKTRFNDILYHAFEFGILTEDKAA
ncbi:uncharacterized protein [Euwallacea fornicatus]|uniref:uncharacterized protein n=1 Tax=Euwallacea fornicatus TaxID=995702 RepID=UPI00338FEC87